MSDPPSGTDARSLLRPLAAAVCTGLLWALAFAWLRWGFLVYVALIPMLFPPMATLLWGFTDLSA